MTRLSLTVVLVLVVSGCASLEVDDSDDGHTGATEPESITTTTVPPTTTTTLPLFEVSGKVTDPSGDPVVRAQVQVGEVTAHSGPDGWFTLATTAPGPVTVSKPGWGETTEGWDEGRGFLQVTLEPRTIRGLRVAASAAGDDAKFEYLLTLADQTAINTFVFDTKQEGGKVLYDTAVAEAHQMGAVAEAYDPAERIAQAHQHDLYVITRIVVFEDWFRVAEFPEEKLAGPWVDPQSESAWDYNIALAVEACALGFDEIQFDYVRFPSGQTAQVSGQLELSQEERVGTIAGFLAKARRALQPLGCALSADIFGIVLATENDQGLGQRPEEISGQVDAVSPMVYPSHYSLGWLGLGDPNEHPYDVTADAIDDGLARMEQGTLLRPWLQAFWWSNGQIRRSIQAAEDRGVGWILWNVLSNFDKAAIPTDAELSD